MAEYRSFWENFDSLNAVIQQYRLMHQFSYPELRNSSAGVQLYGTTFDKDTNWKEAA